MNMEADMKQDTVQQAKDDSQDGKQEEKENTQKENEKLQDEKISEYGQVTLENHGNKHKIHLLSVIGEIEGHENLPGNSKTTKYDHVLPQLAAIEDSEEVEGLLILLNTTGGDVDAGLAIAEMIASLSKPTVSLVLGGSHSIGGPLAVSTDYSFIVPTGTMIIHPVRMNGTILGVPQTYEYFEKIQDRIIGFLAGHCRAKEERIKELMLNTGVLAKDMGSILIGEEAVKEGIIDEVGGIRDAFDKLYELIKEKKKKND